MDKFNEQNVSAFLTAGGAKLMLLHDGRTDDAIRTFFTEVHELYVKARTSQENHVLMVEHSKNILVAVFTVWPSFDEGSMVRTNSSLLYMFIPRSFLGGLG